MIHNMAQKEPNKNFETLDHALFNLGHIQNPNLLRMLMHGAQVHLVGEDKRDY